MRTTVHPANLAPGDVDTFVGVVRVDQATGDLDVVDIDDAGVEYIASTYPAGQWSSFTTEVIDDVEVAANRPLTADEASAVFTAIDEARANEARA